MKFNPGTGATIIAVSVENQFYSLMRMIQELERDTSKNPREASIVTSSEDQDDGIVAGAGSIYGVMESVAGSPVIAYPDPFVQSIFTEGSAGQGTGENIVAAFAERALILIMSERNPVYNPNAIALKFSNVNWNFLDVIATTPVTHNIVFNFSFTLPIVSTTDGNGVYTVAKEYLAGAYNSN